MRIKKTMSFALILSVILLTFVAIPAMASDVPADKYTFTLSGKTGTQSEKIELEEFDDNQAFRTILAEEKNEIVLVNDGAEINFTPNETMSASASYYTVDGAYAGNLAWTIDGSEIAELSKIEANKTASLNLHKRYGGFDCDLFYVFTFGDADTVTKIIFKVVDGTPVKTSDPDVMPSNTVTAAATASKVLVDGKQVSFEAYNINNNNYFKLRDIAMAVNGTAKNFEVNWDNENRAIQLVSEKAYSLVGGELSVSADPTAKQAALSTAKVYLDGNEVQLTAYTIGGNNYFKLRDLGKALGIAITWDSTTNTIGIDTSAEK